MTLQFNPGAYEQAFQIGQQNRQANRLRPLQAIQDLSDTSSSLADTIQKGRQARLLNTPINQLLMSHNATSDPVAKMPEPVLSNAPQTPTPQWGQESDANQGLPSMNPSLTDNSVQPPGSMTTPQGSMIERFRNFQNGNTQAWKAPTPSQPTSSMAALGLPDSVGNMNLQQLETLGKAKQFLAKSNPQDFDYVGITNEGRPVSLNKKTGSFGVGDLPMGTRLQPKSTGFGGPTTENLAWDTASESDKQSAIKLATGNARTTDFGFRDRGRITGLAILYANKNNIPFQSYRGDVNKGAEEYFAYGKGGQNSTSLNTSLGHLDDAMTAYQNLQNTDVNLLNKPINWLKQNTNDPNVVALGINLNALQGELANVFKNSGGTDQEIAKWNQYLNENLTPSQFIAAGQKIDELLRSRLSALNYQQSSSMVGGRQRQLLSPHGAETMQTIDQMKNAAPTAQAAGVPQIGEVRKGYRFKGGNPADPNSWGKI